MQWLEEEFLPYLASWEASVRGREGFTVAEQNKMMLSAETRLGLQFTGIAWYCGIMLSLFFLYHRYIPHFLIQRIFHFIVNIDVLLYSFLQ